MSSIETQNIEIKDLKYQKYLPKDFKSSNPIRWCPGCGDYAILTCLQKALAELNVEPCNTAVISGIGCSSRLPYYMNTYGFHSIHGRANAIATGVKVANPNLSVWVATGDGDSLAIGGNHFIHTIRRNIDITHFVHNNQIYGLTKGQASPTTAMGQKTTLQFDGVKVEPIKPLALSLTMGAGFVARGFSGDIPQLVELMKEAIRFKGYAHLDILQPCVVWNKVNTFSWYKERVYKLDNAYDYTDFEGAYKKSLEFGDKIPTGILYKVEKETYEDRFDFIKRGGPLVDQELDKEELKKLINDFY